MTSLGGRPLPTKCTCCPYGFHIDLDFVTFAENVANGNSPQQQNKPARNTLKEASCNGIRGASPFTRNITSPMESVFSDSLENMVSDFEETALDPSREYCSDKELAGRRAHRTNGYHSDFTPTSKRSLPPRATQTSSYFRGSYGNSPVPNGGHDGLFSAKKPPVAPSSTPTSHLYCTALGRTLSEIKAKQREDLDNGSRPIVASSNGFRKQYEFARPRELSLRSGYESERSSYEQGKTHQMGSKTPEMSRKPMGGLSYQSDSEPPWRRAPSAVQKASNQVDMDGFASVRRKKTDETYSQDEQAHRAHSVHAEWRHGHSVDSSPVPYGSLPLRRELDNLRAQRTNTPSPIQLNGEQHKNAVIRHSTSTGGETDSAVMLESTALSESFRSVSSLPRSTPPVPAKPCCDCIALNEQLTRLSQRLMEMEKLESVRSGKSFEDKAEGTVMVNTSHVSVSTTPPQTSDKNVGSSRPQQLEFGTTTSPVQTANFAGDALCVPNASKATTVSQCDLLSVGWLRDCATSPMPPRPVHSIAMNTDELALLSSKDATTVTELDLNELISLAQRPKSPPPQLTSTACLTDRVSTIDSATDVLVELCPPERAQYMDQCVGADECTTMLDAQCMATPINQESSMQTDPTPTRSALVGTLAVESVHRAMETDRCSTKDCWTACEDACMATTSTQTSAPEPVPNTSKSLCLSIAIQTDFEPEPSEPRVLSDSEMAECLWLMPSRDTTDVAVGSDHDTVDDVDEKNNNHLHNATFHHSLIRDDDKDSLIEETLSDPEAIGFDESAEESPSRQQCADTDTSGDEPSPPPRALGHARAAFVKKLLTDTSPHPESNFVRGTTASKSCRLDSNKGDPLQYIADQHKTQNESVPSTPQTQRGALKEKVILKKEQVVPLSKVPEPIPARIPRPKIAKYNPGEAQAQSPDEEAEVADRLTPLRSEMRTLRTFGNGRMVARSPPQSSPSPVRNTNAAYDNPVVEDDEQSSSCSSDSEGSYDTNEAKGDDIAPPFELSEPLKEALAALQKGIDKPASVETSTMEWATKYAQHEWLKTAARRTACAPQVEGFVDALEALSPKLLSTVVNMTDPNENTALHYAVSHGNFDVVSILLDSRICCLDRANKAGYTPVMLAALCEVNDEVESAVIHRLFQLGNVNAKAVQHGQTALMLAVSHGKMNTTRLLLQCGADLNIQDEEGSTALMCAAEHGHKEIVKLLLSQPDIDASLSDCDSSTALSIAVENGHRDIGVLIYAQLNFGRNEQPSSSSHNEMAASPSVH